MKLIFSYSLKKDIENFKVAAKSVNNPTPTELHEFYIDTYGHKLDDGKLALLIEDFIQKEQLDLRERVATIENDWVAIQDVFVVRCEQMFGITYPQNEISVFLTTNKRCAYNIDEGYFFVDMRDPAPNRRIMHELLHFYTSKAFSKQLEAAGLSASQYNDIKESLTELLNIEFVDLMNGTKDWGYSQHKEMRKKVRKLWLESRDLGIVVKQMAKDLTN